RTSHYIAIDTVRDELFVPNPFAQAILAFRGGATGDEAPLRVIQGPKTLLSQPDNVAVDSVHRELYIAQFTTDSIMVFRSDAQGDVAPLRILRGPRTQLDRPIRVEVDPVNNVMAVTNDSAILIFERTASGDTPPKWVLSGPKTGLGTRFGTRDVKLFPEGKKIVASARAGRGGQRGAGRGDAEGEGGFGGQRFIGVWNYGDHGDVEPWAMLPATPTSRVPGSRLALNPEGNELIVGGGGVIRVYRLPEIFRRAD
ncbi:MAG TPA: hypothetical protein VNN17_09765, partial [Terriglobia bacterium]|nr:hypothetical protein [Terriglobia bacterium]